MPMTYMGAPLRRPIAALFVSTFKKVNWDHACHCECRKKEPTLAQPDPCAFNCPRPLDFRDVGLDVLDAYSGNKEKQNRLGS